MTGDGAWQGYAFKVVTKLEDRSGQDVFTKNKGAGKYGGTELEKDLLQFAIEDRKPPALCACAWRRFGVD